MTDAGATHPDATLRLEADGAVRRLVLNRPDRHNAQTLGMWQEFGALGELLVNDPDVRCVVVTGAGQSFSSGLDSRELQPGGHLAYIAQVGLDDPELAATMIRRIQQCFSWIRTAPFPVIAAVRGAALGAGFELALACDIRIVADDARFALPEVPMGVVPDLGGCNALRAVLGYQRALDLVVTGRSIDGHEAHTLGLALQHLPEAQVEDAAMRYAHTVARAPRAALGYAKRALVEQDDAASLAHAATGMVLGLGHLLGTRTGHAPVEQAEQPQAPADPVAAGFTS